MPVTKQLLLLVVEIDLSEASAAMLQGARSLLLELAPQSQALLLTVIPMPFDASSSTPFLELIP
jgi:hypothetical protein